MTIRRYELTNTLSGVELGTFEGKDGSDALDAFARDAGYDDYADLCSVAPAKPGEIYIRDVTQ